MSGGVRFGPPAHDPAPYIAAGVPIACNVCADDIREHDYLYTLGDVDVYRCRCSGCPCGAASEVRGYALAANPTQADIDAAMAALGAGGGVPVRLA